MILPRALRLFASTSRSNTIRVNLDRNVATKKSKQEEVQKLLDDLYSEVRAQRFEDIVVIQTKFNTNPRYYILATSFNPRHLINGTEMLNRQYKIIMKKDNQDFARMSISSEWNVLDFHSVIVHLFSRECREHYDIEQLWAVGEKHDEHVMAYERSSRSRSTKAISSDLSC